ncbi:MAG TPA: PfkB family carbohydrate kinase [Candidatus Limnocylindrales bacterium]|nr:PfkB family carbohydrate kinase [Candidatus Limnocylindrales bacterium]
MSRPAPDGPPPLLAIGHVTRDEVAGEEGWRLGGSAFYAAATAARLGAPAALLTRVGPAERPALEAACGRLGIALRALPSNVTTTFVISERDGRRHLRLRARARGIGLGDLPAELAAPSAAVFASVAHELDRSLFAGFPGAVRVLAAQGYLREWAADGSVGPRRWDGADGVIARLHALVVSEEDVAADPGGPSAWARRCPVVVTRAERGALLLEGERSSHVPGHAPDRVVDPTGAGDAFAAALALALAGGRGLEDAARFASAAASFAVEGRGIEGLADRARVEARLAGALGPQAT